VKGDFVKGDAVKGGAVNGDAVNGDAVNGDAVKGGAFGARASQAACPPIQAARAIPASLRHPSKSRVNAGTCEQ